MSVISNRSEYQFVDIPAGVKINGGIYPLRTDKNEFRGEDICFLKEASIARYVLPSAGDDGYRTMMTRIPSAAQMNETTGRVNANSSSFYSSYDGSHLTLYNDVLPQPYGNPQSNLPSVTAGDKISADLISQAFSNLGRQKFKLEEVSYGFTGITSSRIKHSVYSRGGAEVHPRDILNTRTFYSYTSYDDGTAEGAGTYDGCYTIATSFDVENPQGFKAYHCDSFYQAWLIRASGIRQGVPFDRNFYLIYEHDTSGDEVIDTSGVGRVIINSRSEIMERVNFTPGAAASGVTNSITMLAAPSSSTFKVAERYYIT